MFPGLMGSAEKAARAAEQRHNMMKGAPLPVGSLRGWFLEREINGRTTTGQLKAEGVIRSRV